MDPDLKARKWKEYLNELLNAEYAVNPILSTTSLMAKPILNEITQDETYKAIASLKTWKALGLENIPPELIKYEGKQLYYAMFKTCQKTWREERVPTSWNKTIIIPLQKRW